jgi:hypothetical protein
MNDALCLGATADLRQLSAQIGHERDLFRQKLQVGPVSEAKAALEGQDGLFGSLS